MREEAAGDLEGMMELSGLASLQQSQNNGERGLAVRFSLEPMQNEQKTKEKGRPIFDEVEICEIRVSGSTDTVREVVTTDHRRRFPGAYLAFKQNQDQDAASGTPLVQWPLLSRAQAEEARYFGVRTVEQLSEVSDVNLQKLGAGWMVLRQQARDWLGKAKDGALLGKLRQELEERDRRIDAMEKMLAKQSAEIEAARGGSLPPVAAGPDPRMAALEKKLEELLSRKSEDVTINVAPRRKRKYTRRAKPAVEAPEG